MSGPSFSSAFFPTPSVTTECAHVVHINSGMLSPNDYAWPEATVIPTVLPAIQVFPPIGNNYKRDYFEALEETRKFRQDIERAKDRLVVWAIVFKYTCIVYNILSNGIALATVIVASGFFEFSATTIKTLTIITFVVGLSVWFQLGEKSKEYLSDSKDLQRAEAICLEMETLLAEAITDDFIDSVERDKIHDMLRKMYLAGESISFLGMFMHIVGDVNIANKARSAFGKIRGMIRKVSKKSVRIEEKEPLLAREARASRIFTVV